MTTDPPAAPEGLDTSNTYAPCWKRLEDVEQLRGDFAAAWSRFLDGAPYEISITTEWDGTGTMSVWSDWPDDVADELAGIISNLAAVLQAALDEAVRATVRLLTGQTPDEQSADLRFPICVGQDEFQTYVDHGALDGLRPDQLRLVQSLQPIPTSGAVPAGLQMMRNSLLFLRSLTSAGASVRVVGWGHSAAPELEVELPASIAELIAEPDGYVELHPVVARFRLNGYQPDGRTAVSGTPNIAVDAAAHVDPPPAAGDDTLSSRTRNLLAVVRGDLGLTKEEIADWRRVFPTS